MKKLLINLILISCLLFSGKAFASIDDVVQKSPLSKNSLISISLKNTQTSSTLYEKNSNIMVLPASTLKLFTMKAAADTLGYDYKFKTAIYKDKNSNLYIKLSGNPFLTSEELTKLLKNANKTSKAVYYKTIFIDDKALDSYNWGIGWSWDNETEDGMQKFGAYNLDNNMLTLDISVDSNKKKINISQKNNYKINTINMLSLGEENNIIPIKQNKIFYLTGTVKDNTRLNIPTDNICDYFVFKLKKSLAADNIKYTNISFKQVPTDASLIFEQEQDIKPILEDILKNSNNFVAETVFKTAGGKYQNRQGSIINATEMFNQYYTKLNVNPLYEVDIADGSGVSRKNKITSDWATSAMIAISKENDFEQFKEYLPTSGEGTLNNRLIRYGDNLSAKTGTLDGTSALVGYLRTRKGTPTTFAIYIQNYKFVPKYAKALEDNIVKEIYEKY